MTLIYSSTSPNAFDTKKMAMAKWLQGGAGTPDSGSVTFTPCVNDAFDTRLSTLEKILCNRNAADVGARVWGDEATQTGFGEDGKAWGTVP